jgi:EpsI family protein
MREYVHDGDAAARHPVLLCITFSAGSHRIAHPAEVCYEGQGWDVAVNEEIVLDLEGEGAGQEVNHLLISRKEERCEVIVWYRTSTQETSSFIRQKFEMLFAHLFGGRRWSAMIRLSAFEEPGSEATAIESLEKFAQALHPHLDVLGREMESR